MKVILGHKVGMTQLWAANGRLISGTVILAKENSVVTKGESQTTIGVATTGKTNQPQQKIAGTLGSKRGIWLKSLPVKIESDTLTVDQFEVGEKVSVTGITKGKGFAGGVKRHGFHGWPASHGHSHQRRVYSILVRGRNSSNHWASRAGQIHRDLTCIGVQSTAFSRRCRLAPIAFHARANDSTD